MTAERTIVCGACGASVSPEVPEYYIELECFRMISEQEGDMPRRGSKEYHKAVAELSPKIKMEYYKNRQMYAEGHLWCPVCGFRLSGAEEGRLT